MNISDETMQSVVAKAILDSIGPDERASLLTNAVKALLAPQKDGYTTKPSVIEQAFNSAVRTVAEQMAYKEISEDTEFRTKIKKLFEDVAEKLFADDDYNKLVVDMAATIARGLSRDRY